MFFAPGRKYAVLGASTNRGKFGNKILRWYINHKLPVKPINPSAEEVEGVKAYPTLNKYIEDLSISDEPIGVSVVTPPQVSFEMFKEVLEKRNGDKIASIWFQPGSFDSKVVKYVIEKLGVSKDSVISNNDCILVSGESKLRDEI